MYHEYAAPNTDDLLRSYVTAKSDLLVQVMVANIRCGEILNDQLRALQDDQAWTSLAQAAQSHLVPTFGSQASGLLESCLAGVLQLPLSPVYKVQYMRPCWLCHKNSCRRHA